MSSIYQNDIFDPIQTSLEIYQIKRPVILSPELWKKFRIDDLNIDYTLWRTVKLMDNGQFSKDLNKITNEYGGIYVYCIEPRIIPNVGCYVMYIGKASKTRNENLRKRVQSYRIQTGDAFTRDRLHSLFEKWGDYIYVHYLPMNVPADAISTLEDRLIAAFGRPPCNADVSAKSVNKAIKAFV